MEDLHVTELGLLITVIGGIFMIIGKILDKIELSPITPDYKKDAEIDGLISLLRHKYGCSRMSILGYHNGGHWINNISISKFTCRHESVGLGTDPLLLQMQGISTSCLKEMPSILKEKQFLFEANITKMRQETNYNPAYYEMMRQFGTSSTIAIGIHSPIFKWRKFRYETELVASIHMNWADDTWIKSLMKSRFQRLELINELHRLVNIYEPKAKDILVVHDIFNEKVKETKTIFGEDF